MKQNEFAESARKNTGLKGAFGNHKVQNAVASGNSCKTMPVLRVMPGRQSLGGEPTALRTLPYPLILNRSPNFGAQSNGFSFTASWATNLSVIVEASTNLSNPVWQPLQTNTLKDDPVGGSFEFIDPNWTNYSGRFYRITTP